MKSATALTIAWLILVPLETFAGRPLTIDDAPPVSKSQFELEIGFAYARPEDGGRDQRWPVFGLSYGVLDGLELGIAIQRVNEDKRGGAAIQGFEDLHLTAKYLFLGQTVHSPALALAVDLKVPTANRRKGLTTGRTDANFLLIASQELSQFAVDLNLGYLVVSSPPEENLKNRLLAGLAVRWTAHERCVLVGEVFGQSREARAQPNDGNFQIGARYQLAPPAVLDAAVGRSLRSTGSRVHATFGLTWLFSLLPKEERWK